MHSGLIYYRRGLKNQLIILDITTASCKNCNELLRLSEAQNSYLSQNWECNALKILKKYLCIVILQENGCLSWFSWHKTLSFGWDSYFTAENISVLQYPSNKVQWSCLLWSADFIDPLYTRSSHCAVTHLAKASFTGRL